MKKKSYKPKSTQNRVAIMNKNNAEKIKKKENHKFPLLHTQFFQWK